MELGPNGFQISHKHWCVFIRKSMLSDNRVKILTLNDTTTIKWIVNLFKKYQRRDREWRDRKGETGRRKKLETEKRAEGPSWFICFDIKGGNGKKYIYVRLLKHYLLLCY